MKNHGLSPAAKKLRDMSIYPKGAYQSGMPSIPGRPAPSQQNTASAASTKLPAKVNGLKS